MKRLLALLLLLPSLALAQPISGLPPATLPLSGTEVVPIVQLGTTKKAPASAFGGGGSGSVTSVGVASTDGCLSVSGSPITTAGTINLGVVCAPKWSVGRTLSITGDLAYTSPVFDGSANVSAGGTLATVNANVGTFGDSTHVAQVTLDGKGRTTAASSVAISFPSGVTTTGSPASGNLTKFSGASSITNGDLSGDCTTSATLATICLKTNGVSFGTFATQNYATPPAIGGTTPAAGAFTTLGATGALTTNVTGSTQCVQANSAGVISGTGSICGSGSGSVTSVTCGTGLSGGVITTTGTCSLTAPVTVALGGTNATSASGTALDNITGFASTGFLTRTGAGAYAFQSTTNGITLGNLAQIGANTVLGNATAGTANITALSVPSCSAATSALTYTLASGFGCNTITPGTGTVTHTVGALTSGQLVIGNGSADIKVGDLSGDVSTSGSGVTTIGALKVATGMIQASAVTLAKIANAAASSKLLGSGASGAGAAYAELSLGTGLSMVSTTLTPAVGSAAQLGIVQVDGTTITASAGVISAVAGYLVQRTVTSGSQASVTISTSGIPANFNHLSIRITARGLRASSQFDDMGMRFNGDTGNNYYTFQLNENSAGGAAPSNFQSVTNNLIPLGPISASTAPANNAGQIEVTVLNYANTTWNKLARAIGFSQWATVSGSQYGFDTGGQWQSTAALTSIVVFPLNAGFVNGSIVEVVAF